MGILVSRCNICMEQVTSAADLGCYRIWGQPAKGFVLVKQVPSGASALTIGDEVYVYNTHFFGNTKELIAQSLAAVINSDIDIIGLIPGDGTYLCPIRKVYAVTRFSCVHIIATEPGIDGNSLPLVCVDTSSFAISGALLTGGTNGLAAMNGNVFDGNGSPEGIVTVTRPSIYIQKDGVGRFWTNPNTSGNMGWNY